jgi:nicotinate phosphoribosyltransferase
MNALLTDLYQLTMSAGYWQAGKSRDVATFELFLRRLPAGRNYVVACGLRQAVEYLLNLRFKADEIDYLRGLPQFALAPSGFFDALREFRFTGDVFAAEEGTPMFAGEPLLVLRAPLIEAQLPETYLLATIGFQTMVATKASRIVEAAGGRSVVEFGTRRAHSPEAGVYAARAAYIGGCSGTSNTLAGMKFGIPVFGTAAHSWVLSFVNETEAFRELQRLLGPVTTYLLDTYDTIEGAKKVVELGRPLSGVRLDSGDLVELSKAVRKVLDAGGMQDVKIMATGDLNEHKILELMAESVPIDTFGVGTELATSSDAPSHGAIYKLVELRTGGETRYTAKLSAEKATLPGAKQVFRYAKRDLLALADECPSGNGCEALLRPVILRGELVEPLPSAAESRQHAERCRMRLPKKLKSLFEAEAPWPVERSAKLQMLTEFVQQGIRENAR